MNDFLSDETLRDPSFPLQPDCLGHEARARLIHERLTKLPPAVVVAVFGGWGRGKTDVLARMYKQVDEAEGDRAVWINPWQYGTPDLLTPLVIAVLKRLASTESTVTDWQAVVRRAATSLVRAGISFGLKAAAVSMGPAGGLVTAAGDEVDKFIGAVMDSEKEATSRNVPDSDPVAAMGNRFKELVDLLLPPERARRGARMFVFVDDLDRCLPDRHVAMLQAIRFLLSSGANATFVVALDPEQACRSIAVHYGSENQAFLDPQRYLDKMFELRLVLPTVDGAQVTAAIRSALSLEIAGRAEVRRLDEDAPEWVKRMATEGPRALSTPDARNPRLVARALRRLSLLVESGVQLPELAQSEAKNGARWALAWLLVAERWPEARTAFQHRVQEAPPATAWTQLTAAVKGGDQVEAALMRVTGNDRNLQSLWKAFDQSNSADFIALLDGAMREAGL